MLKRCLSMALVICMMLSLGSVLAMADYSYIEGFKENNMSAKQIVVAKGHAFVASGADETATDVINVYNLESRNLVATLKCPVYETGRDYYAENMLVVGDYMYISWNRNKGWGDPSVRKYEIDKMLAGELKAVKSYGVRGDHASCVYGDKVFYIDPKIGTLDIINADGVSTDVMSMKEVNATYLEKNLKALCADSDYFYIVIGNEIRAYKTDKVYSGLMQLYAETVAVYTSDKDIKDVKLLDGKLYVTSAQGLDILKIEEKEIKKAGEYTSGGEVMGVTVADGNLYLYTKNTNSIKILDVNDLSEKGEISAKNSKTSGIADIYVDGNRIYAADLTDGFTLYSANEFDKLQVEQTAESYAEELSQSAHAKAIELCVGLRIMDLRANGMFESKGYITRGEFAQSAAKLLGDKISGKSVNVMFSDVPLDSPYIEGINGLASIGVINGYGDGTFGPDDVVLYEHAVKIMVSILGYAPLTQNSNVTYMNIASDIGLLDNVCMMPGGTISRENVARMIYNALDIPTLKFSSGVNPSTYDSYKEDILLHEMGIKKAKGKISATELTSLTGGYTASKGKVEIGSTQYPEGASGAGKYLGRNVTFYYRFDESTENGEIVYVVPNVKDEVIVVPAEDVLESTSKTEFVFKDENEDTKRENIKNASIIINGVFDRAFTEEDLKPIDGEVMLLDDDADGDIDTVIIRSYKTYAVEAYSKGLFRLKYGFGEINLNKLIKNGGKVSVYVDGYLAEDIDDIIGVKAFSILSVVQSRGEEVTEIYVTNNSAIGMITNVVNGKTMSIEGTEYEINKTYLENVKKPENNILAVGAGDEVYAYLDMFGKIAATKDASSGYEYGYLVACDRGDGLNTDQVNFKLLVDDENELHGSMKKFVAAQNFKVNDKKIEDIYTVAELFDPMTGLKEQLIKFRLSHEGKIKDVYTAKDKVNAEISDGVPNPYYDANYIGYTEHEFTYDAKISKSIPFRAGDMGTFEGEPFVPNINTKIFIVPNTDVITDAKDSEYQMYDNNSLFRSGTYPPGAVNMYDIGADYNVAALVIKKGSEVNVDAIVDSSSYLIVDSFEKGLDENGEEVTVLVSAKDASGNQTKINLLNDEIEDPAGTCNKAYLGVKLVDVPKGTVIQYLKNARGYLAAMRILYMPTEEKTYFEYGSPSAPRIDYMSVTFYTSFAKVIRLASNRIIFNGHGFAIDDDGDGNADRQWDGNLAEANRKWDRNLKAADAVVYLYDSVTDKISTVTLSQVMPEDDIFIVKDSIYTELIVIYR